MDFTPGPLETALFCGLFWAGPISLKQERCGMRPPHALEQPILDNYSSAIPGINVVATFACISCTPGFLFDEIRILNLKI